MNTLRFSFNAAAISHKALSKPRMYCTVIKNKPIAIKKVKKIRYLCVCYARPHPYRAVFGCMVRAFLIWEFPSWKLLQPRCWPYYTAIRIQQTCQLNTLTMDHGVDAQVCEPHRPLSSSAQICIIFSSDLDERASHIFIQVCASPLFSISLKII